MSAPGWKNGMKLVGEYWHFRFMWKGQIKQGSTKLKSYRQAKTWIDEYKVNLAKAEQGIAPAPTVQAAFDNWCATYTGKLSQNHIDRAESAFRLHILPICGAMACDQITKEVAEALRSRYLEGPTKHEFGDRTRKMAGCNTMIRYLKNILTHALGRCPFKLKIIKEAEVHRAYVPMELVPAFLTEIDRTQNEHLSVAIRAMIYMGLRESEALGMRWDWFSPDLTTYTPSLTKGKEAWDLPVHPDLQAHLKALPHRLGLVLPWIDDEGSVHAHTQGFTKKAMRRASEVIGVSGLTPHSLRRTAATLMHRAGVGIKTIQRQMRHKNISTTLGYVQVGLDELVEAQQKVWGV